MAIFKPGVKFRNSRILSRHNTKREVTAMLSLTAMVDMFTVLVVFLLQNYSATGDVLYIPKEVTLPKAEQIKELKPAVVVTISTKEILVDKDSILATDQLKNQSEWMITQLHDKVVTALEIAKQKYERDLQIQLQKAVGPTSEKKAEDVPWNKVTIQADKGMDFLTVKKVMYTVSEAGAREINFAVMKEKLNH